MDALRRIGSEAYDTVEHVVNIERPPHPRSECIAALDFKNHCVAGLPLILAVCCAISTDRGAHRYTLREFNCYFFSWTIISSIARYCVAWEKVPYDPNFLSIPGDRLSQTMAQGVMDELVGILPRSLSSALLIALPEMLIINILECTLTLPEDLSALCRNPERLRSSLNAERFRTRLSRILQRQCQVITQTLRSTSNCEDLRKAIESTVRQECRRSHLNPRTLSVLLRRLLWQSDIAPTLSSDGDQGAVRWCSRASSNQIVGGHAMWEVVSNMVIGWITKDIQASASSQITDQVQSVMEDILGVATCSTFPLGEAKLAPVTATIVRVINASILLITECNVRYAMNQVYQRMKVVQTAIQDSIIHAVDDLFPDDLPIGLRIPAAQNSWLRRVLWLARPESAFCLWRTSRGIQNCNSVKHKELQNYLSKRINAHSRDVTILGERSQEVETFIRKAMSRIWLASSREVKGINARLEKEKLLASLIDDRPGRASRAVTVVSTSDEDDWTTGRSARGRPL